MRVVYKLNNIKFYDLGVYISKSKSLLDKLKPKTRRSYNWAEYHGKAIDLSKPKYEEREITLEGWVEGENWQDMNNKFNTLLKEFDKEGTQRLIVEFGGILAYDVYLSDSVELVKKFKNGKMYGLFTLKVREPRPVKKVLLLEGANAVLNLTMSFSDKQVIDINVDGIEHSNWNQQVINIQNYNMPENESNRNIIIVSGNLEELISFETNAEIIQE